MRKQVWLTKALTNWQGRELSGGSPIYWIHVNLIKKN